MVETFSSRIPDLSDFCTDTQLAIRIPSYSDDFRATTPAPTGESAFHAMGKTATPCPIAIRSLGDQLNLTSSLRSPGITISTPARLATYHTSRHVPVVRM
jgi:hypothetical protein